MKAEPNEAGTVFEAGEDQFVSGNETETDKGNGQCVPVKQCDAEQGQREKPEIEWNSEEKNWFSQRGSSPFAREFKFGGAV
jgi:hypothetical protein